MGWDEVNTRKPTKLSSLLIINKLWEVAQFLGPKRSKQLMGLTLGNFGIACNSMKTQSHEPNWITCKASISSMLGHDMGTITFSTCFFLSHQRNKIYLFFNILQRFRYNTKKKKWKMKKEKRKVKTNLNSLSWYILENVFKKNTIKII